MTVFSAIPHPAHLPDAGFIKAKVSAGECLVYQPYLNPDQRAELHSKAIPFDISFNTSAGTREYELFKTLYDHHKAIALDDTAFWGLVSSKFELKAATPFSSFLAAANEARDAGFDGYAYNPMIANAAMYANVWEQGIATGHTGLDKIFEFLLSSGYPAGQPQGHRTFFFCNYICGNDRFWRGYFNYCERILGLLDEDGAAGRPAGLAYRGGASYSRDANAGMRPFVIERLLGLYLQSAVADGLRIATFNPTAADFDRKFGARMGGVFYRLFSQKDEAIERQDPTLFQAWRQARNVVASQPALAIHADDPPGWLPAIASW